MILNNHMFNMHFNVYFQNYKYIKKFTKYKFLQSINFSQNKLQVDETLEFSIFKLMMS
jgi:hypothetical protein